MEALNEDMLGRVLGVMEEGERHGWEFVTERRGITVHRKFMVRGWVGQSSQPAAQKSKRFFSTRALTFFFLHLFFDVFHNHHH